mgnify:CR=1 FL=1
MKTGGKQKNLYMLALMLLIAAVALACVWTFMNNKTASSDRTITPVPTVNAPEETIDPNAQTTASQAASAAQTPAPAKGKTMSTVVYYQDNYGYLVPVQCKVPAEDGIAKATLSLMVKSTANDMQAARLGLRTVLPDGCTGIIARAIEPFPARRCFPAEGAVLPCPPAWRHTPASSTVLAARS